MKAAYDHRIIDTLHAGIHAFAFYGIDARRQSAKICRE